MQNSVDIVELAYRFSMKRGDRPLRDIAAETDVSASTLSRIERGETPDLPAFLAVCNWLNMPATRFLVYGDSSSKENGLEDLLIELTSDPDIDAGAANAIAYLVNYFAKTDK